MPPRLLLTNADVEGNPEGWLEARRALITASEIPTIAGLTPGRWASPWSLFWRKVNGDGERQMSLEQELGHYMEPWTAARFELTHPQYRLGDGGLFVRSDRPWQGATFDRLAYPAWMSDTSHAMCELGMAVCPVQLKTAGSLEDWGTDPDEGIVPDHIRAQCLWEADVLGDHVQRVYVPMFYRPTGKTRTYIIEIDAVARADQEWLRGKAAEFRGRLERGDPPPIDWTEATARTLKAQHPDIDDDLAVVIPRSLQERKQRATAAEQRLKIRVGQVNNELRHRMGRAKRAVVIENGKQVTVVSRSISPRANGKDVDSLHPGRGAKPPREDA